MLKYIYHDLISTAGQLPCSLAFGVPVVILFLWLVNAVRRRRGRESVLRLPTVIFGIYLFVLLTITFLSRESGTKTGPDFKLFSTWGINKRNNAFVVENVLLFIPYGFCGSWAFAHMRRFWNCLFFGALTSLCIETLQLATGRGFFQIDDILTNTLGAAVGFLLFQIVSRISRA